LGASLVREIGTEAQCALLLRQVAAGGVRIACALSGSAGHPPQDGIEVRLERGVSDPILTGSADFVIHADSADLLLVLARESGGELVAALLPAGTPGVTIRPHVMLDLTRPMSHITFRDVAVTRQQQLGDGGRIGPALLRGLDRARIALAAEALGGAERVLEMTTEYVKQRVQFGRAVGSFQAVKHRLADMMVQVEAAKSAVWYAACVADEGGDELAEAAAIAKSYCCDAFYQCAANAIQLHGGIGFTWEHDAHLYFKRARATATLLGSPAWHRERLLRALGLGEAPTPVF
jgi:alkylation response protein AidB-like acyl-CoA dehydrogenase